MSKRTLFDVRAMDESITDFYLIISWCPVLDNFLIIRHRYGIGQLFDVRNVNIASTDILLTTLWWSISDRFSMVPYGYILGSSFDFLSRTTFCNTRPTRGHPQTYFLYPWNLRHGFRYTYGCPTVYPRRKTPLRTILGHPSDVTLRSFNFNHPNGISFGPPSDSPPRI